MIADVMTMRKYLRNEVAVFGSLFPGDEESGLCGVPVQQLQKRPGRFGIGSVIKCQGHAGFARMPSADDRQKETPGREKRGRHTENNKNSKGNRRPERTEREG